MFYFISALVFAQDAPFIIKLKEESTTGKYMDTIPATGPAIVDINSIIHIKIDIASLENEMFRFQGIAGSDERLNTLNEINKTLRNQNEILKLINNKFSGSEQASVEDYKELIRMENELLTELSPDVYDELNGDEEMLEEIYAYLKAPGNYYIEFVIDYLAGKADKLRNSLMNNLAMGGTEVQDSSLLVYFRLGAFLKDKSGGRPVHVVNFDEISPESYTEIARFSPPVSSEAKNALAITKQLNDSIKDNSTQATVYFGEVVKALFPSDSLRIKLEGEYDSSLSALTERDETKPAAKVLLENHINIKRIERLTTLTTESYKLFAGNFPEGIFNDNNFDKVFDDLEQLVVKAYKEFNKDVKQFQISPDALTTDVEKSGLAQLQIVDNSYKDYVDSVIKDISGIKNIVTNIKSLLDPFRKSYLKNEELTEQVARFTAGRIPENGFIELKTIGERKAGDEILIKAVMERGRDRSNPNFEQKELFRRYIGMERIDVHLKMSGSLILANPYHRHNEDVKLTNRYQFAPNYGIFLKWGSRRSKFYNDFLSLGVGLGFSSPDFNLDGTPEFGAGIITTAFKDIFSMGWGWNFGVDAPYFFMGFNIPFTVNGLQSATPEFK
jgi:hypothetical protein